MSQHHSPAPPKDHAASGVSLTSDTPLAGYRICQQLAATLASDETFITSVIQATQDAERVLSEHRAPDGQAKEGQGNEAETQTAAEKVAETNLESTVAKPVKAKRVVNRTRIAA